MPGSQTVIAGVESVAEAPLQVGVVIGNLVL